MQAWVVGGTSGIGAEIVEQLEQRDIEPLVISNDTAAGAKLKNRGGVFEYLDLAHAPREVAHRTEDLLQHYGHPVFVFMSAGLTRERSALDTTLEDWWLLANVNLLGVVQLCNTVAQAWRSVAFEPWKRHVVMLGSVNALRPLPSQGAYSVMKAGLHAYAKCLSNDMTP
ncbi:MAG: SDR family oxidoreductase, partial [Firmicutes bacterium]|nr:SDR family oxidoreductase [Bacillota bacterium]